jgi:hypothetical protein
MDFIGLKFREITPKMKHTHKKMLDNLNQKELHTHTHTLKPQKMKHTFKKIPLEVESTHTFKNKPPKMLN